MVGSVPGHPPRLCSVALRRAASDKDLSSSRSKIISRASSILAVRVHGIDLLGASGDIGIKGAARDDFGATIENAMVSVSTTPICGSELVIREAYGVYDDLRN